MPPRPTAQAGHSRVAIVLNDDFSMFHFFRGLISELIARGFTVFVMTPDGPFVPRLAALGATHIPIEFERFISPIADVRTLRRLRRELSANGITLVCNITAKPIVLGSIAARLAGVDRVVGMIEGLGYAFEAAGGWRRTVLRSVVSTLYRLGCVLSDRIGFANEDDRAVFVEAGLITSDKSVAFRSMVGVDVDECSAGAVDLTVCERLRKAADLEPGQLLITMVTRVVWSKGIREFVEAAEIVAARFPHVRFLLVGPLDPKSPESVPEEYLLKHVGRHLRWIGFCANLRELLHVSDVVVLPSYYREGVPRILLEGLAMGKPIVTTDHVGCREAVEDGRNGFLVPPRDPAALADALCRVIDNSALRQDFGLRSRVIAERDFDQRAVIARVLADVWAVS